MKNTSRISYISTIPVSGNAPRIAALPTASTLIPILKPEPASRRRKTMIRRSTRDPFWLAKHFLQGIFTGKEYWHPEDFWWGKDDLWDWSIELGAWRWLGIFFANLSMALTGFILIPITVHAFLLILRPDIVVWNELFNTNSLVGWFYLAIYAASFFLALITTFTSYRKFRAEQLRRGSN